MADDDAQIERSTDQARAGSTPGVGRYVLVISTLLLIVLFAALLLF